MIVTGPARDGTRLGLIDVGVPRCICWRLVRTRASFFVGGRFSHAGQSENRSYKTVRWCFGGIETGVEECATGIVTQCQLSRSLVRN